MDASLVKKNARKHRKCSIVNCGGRQGQVSLHVTPAIIKNQGEEELSTSTMRRKRWIEAINVKYFDQKKTLVCSRHFVSGINSSIDTIAC